jgi:hypothetical protein
MTSCGGKSPRIRPRLTFPRGATVKSQVVYKRRRRGWNCRNGRPPLPAKSRARQLSRSTTTRVLTRRKTRVSQTPSMRCVPVIAGPPRGIMQLLWPIRAGRKGTKMPLLFTATRTAVRSSRVAADIAAFDCAVLLCAPEPEQPTPDSKAAARSTEARRATTVSRYVTYERIVTEAADQLRQIRERWPTPSSDARVVSR